MSKRKPHNTECGYIAEKIFKPSGSHIVIYIAEAQGIDVAPDKYAVVCSTHGTIVGTSSVPKARTLMKSAEFCEECTKYRGHAKRGGERLPNENTHRMY